MKDLINKIIYNISIISIIVLCYMTVEVMPFIFKSGVQGIIYLIFLFIFLISELIIYIYNKRIIKKSITYNFFIFAITTYVSILYYKIYTEEVVKYMLNSVSIKYLQDNFLLLSCALLFIILYLYMLVYEKKKEGNL